MAHYDDMYSDDPPPRDPLKAQKNAHAGPGYAHGYGKKEVQPVSCVCPYLPGVYEVVNGARTTLGLATITFEHPAKVMISIRSLVTNRDRINTSMFCGEYEERHTLWALAVRSYCEAFGADPKDIYTNRGAGIR